jgi:hypothetical protein
MHGLSDADLALQAAARGFADELIPLEVEAELAGGELPTDVRDSHAERARALGLTATNIPVEHGGRGCTTLQQVLVQEQGGRVTNALAWVMTTPPGWLPASRHRSNATGGSVPPSAGTRSSATPSPRSTRARTWSTWPPRPGGTATTTCWTARSGT